MFGGLSGGGGTGVCLGEGYVLEPSTTGDLPHSTDDGPLLNAVTVAVYPQRYCT